MANVANIRQTLVNAFGALAERTGKKGRPVSRTFFAFANNYLANLSAKQEELVHKNPKAIAVLLDTCHDERMELSHDQVERLGYTTDAHYMGMLDDEPCQVDVNTRILIRRKKVNETLGRAFARRWNHIANTAQAEANEANKTVYAVVMRYAICRDARTQKEATKANIADLTFVPSKNIGAVFITDNVDKKYKGYVAIAGEWSPIAKTKRVKGRTKARRSLSRSLR